MELDQLCLHDCSIIGKGGAYWPQPTYKVVAMDRADEPLLAKSCTGCWTQVPFFFSAAFHEDQLCSTMAFDIAVL